MNQEKVKLIESVLKNTNEFKLNQYIFEVCDDTVIVTAIGENNNISEVFNTTGIVSIINIIDGVSCFLSYSTIKKCVQLTIF